MCTVLVLRRPTGLERFSKLNIVRCLKDVSVVYKHQKQPCSRASSALVSLWFPELRSATTWTSAIGLTTVAAPPTRCVTTLWYAAIFSGSAFHFLPPGGALAAGLKALVVSAGLLPLRQLQDGLHWGPGQGLQAGDQLREQPDQPLRRPCPVHRGEGRLHHVPGIAPCYRSPHSGPSGWGRVYQSPEVVSGLCSVESAGPVTGTCAGRTRTSTATRTRS